MDIEVFVAIMFAVVFDLVKIIPAFIICYFMRNGYGMSLSMLFGAIAPEFVISRTQITHNFGDTFHYHIAGSIIVTTVVMGLVLMFFGYRRQ